MRTLGVYGATDATGWTSFTPKGNWQDGFTVTSGAGTLSGAPNTFTLSAAKNVTAGATYSASGASGAVYTVKETIIGGTALSTQRTTAGSGNPNTSGTMTLTKLSGTGDSPITFTSWAKDTMIIHVASDAANDLGTGSSTSPYLNIFTGIAKCRSSSHDWLLLKKGGIWTDQTFCNSAIPPAAIGQSGISADEPFVIGSYDPTNPNVVNPATGGARPKVRNSNANAEAIRWPNGSYGGGNNIAVIGIHFTAYQADPTASPFVKTAAYCMNQLSGANSLLVEDCRIEYYLGAIDLHGDLGIDSAARTGFTGYIRRNIIRQNNDQGFHGNPGAASTDPTQEQLYIEENFIDNNGSRSDVSGFPNTNVFLHNLYMDGYTGTGEMAAIPGYITVRGNVISHDTTGQTQFRAGGNIYNNTFLSSPTGHNFGNLWQRTTNIYDNVYLDMQGTCIAAIDYYKGLSNSHPGTNIYRNVFAHGNVANSGRALQLNKANGITYYDNIVYKFGANNNNNSTGVISPPTGGVCYTANQNNFLTAGITPGSGLTDKTTTVTALTRNSKGYVVLTVLNVAALELHGEGDSLWFANIGGMTGLNDRMWCCSVSGSQLTLNDSSAVTGTYTPDTSVGNVYGVYRTSSFTNVSNGSNGGWLADICVVNGGVKAIAVAGSHGGDAATEPGGGYTVGDILTSTIGGVTGATSGFRVVVPEITSGTNAGNNVADFNGTGTIASNPSLYPDPERDAGTYYNRLFGGTGGTSQNFIDACLLQSKVNWNIQLTADQLNRYVREGFGMSSGASPRGKIRIRSGLGR